MPFVVLTVICGVLGQDAWLPCVGVPDGRALSGRQRPSVSHAHLLQRPRLTVPALIVVILCSAPCGRVHWAGTELAERMAGFMDGAVSSGRRAAAEVIEK